MVQNEDIKSAIKHPLTSRNTICDQLRRTKVGQAAVRRLRLEADPSSVRRSLISAVTYSAGASRRSRCRFSLPTRRDTVREDASDTRVDS
jgi:hypothetical protein